MSHCRTITTETPRHQMPKFVERSTSTQKRPHHRRSTAGRLTGSPSQPSSSQPTMFPLHFLELVLHIETFFSRLYWPWSTIECLPSFLCNSFGILLYWWSLSWIVDMPVIPRYLILWVLILRSFPYRIRYSYRIPHFSSNSFKAWRIAVLDARTHIQVT